MREHITFWRVFAVVVVAALLLSWWQQSRDDGGIVDPASVESAAREAIVRFADENAAMCRAMAKAIDRGDIETTEQMVSWFEDHRETAEERAFMEVNDMLHEDLPRNDRDELEQRAASAFFEALARGYEEIE